jgi:hypothetical protein
MAKRKKTNNEVQNTTQKTKDWATRTKLRPGSTRSTSRINKGAISYALLL